MTIEKQANKPNSHPDDASLIWEDYRRFLPSSLIAKRKVRLYHPYKYLSTMHNISSSKARWAIIKQWEAAGYVRILKYWGIEIRAQGDASP